MGALQRYLHSLNLWKSREVQKAKIKGQQDYLTQASAESGRLGVPLQRAGSFFATDLLPGRQVLKGTLTVTCKTHLVPFALPLPAWLTRSADVSPAPPGALGFREPSD